MRTLHLHAGTHKTASTYVQSRLYENREQLLAQGVKVCAPPSRTQAQHRPLAIALEKGDWNTWDTFLGTEQHASEAELIVSAEQFARPLAQPQTAESLTTILKKHGFKLNLIFFLRDQVDYINAIYVHTLRRFYHGHSFQRYTRRLSNGEDHGLHYNQQWAHLLTSSHLNCVVRPFHTRMEDPFIQLLQAIRPELAAMPRWKPAPQDKANIQPGAKGVWLAPHIRHHLLEAGVDPRALLKPGQAIRTLSERHGWHQQRYWGFTPELAATVAARFTAHNDRFASLAWGKTWEEAVPSAREQPQAIYDPGEDGGDQEREKQALIREGIDVLRQVGNAIPVG